MKAEKVTVTITVECLSLDVLPGLLGSVMVQVDNEVESGKLRMADGDQVEWDTVRQPVEF